MKKLYSLLFVVVSIFAIAGCSTQQNTLNKYEDNMVGKVWITTEAVDNTGKVISPTDPKVNAFFGIAEYYKNGTFKILTPEGKLKLWGDWSINKDGSQRELIAKKADGSVMFKRAVENVTVSANEYTYRVYPNAADKSVYFDIIHKPLSGLLK